MGILYIPFISFIKINTTKGSISYLVTPETSSSSYTHILMAQDGKGVYMIVITSIILNYL